jgi:hypothetical protein
LTAVRDRLLLALGATALTLLGVEIALRGIERATGVDFFHVMLDERSTNATTELRLIDLIQLSPDEELIYELAPRIRGQFKGAPVATDERGVRVPESGAEPEGSLRLIGIGDSHTFGWGVAWQDTFLAQIADRFAREHAGRRVAVTNFGVPGYNTHQEAELLAVKALGLQPDAVVLLADQNDAGLANFIRAPRNPWSLERSYLVDFLEIRLKRLWRAEAFHNRFLPQGLLDARSALGERVIDGVSEAELDELPPQVRHMAGTAAVDRALDRIGALARAHEIPVVLAFYDEPGGAALREQMFARARDRAARRGPGVAGRRLSRGARSHPRGARAERERQPPDTTPPPHHRGCAVRAAAARAARSPRGGFRGRIRTPRCGDEPSNRLHRAPARGRLPVVET